jgi:hypothetical protein
LSGQRKALIVASDEYEQEGLRNLLAPAADAEALRQVLGDPQIGDFTVQVVHNEPAHVVSARIEDLFLEGRPDDLLLLHFSCHGLKSDSGELFFAARNTRPDRLGSTAVSADFVQRCMRASRSRNVVLLLDCCYGGAFAQGVSIRASDDVNVLDSFPPGQTGGGRGRVVITASSAMEYAFEGDRLAADKRSRPSVFTAALVEGLTSGEADLDQDGWISVDELYDYIFDKVREQNPHQTPGRHIELVGELYVARSRTNRRNRSATASDETGTVRSGAESSNPNRSASSSPPISPSATVVHQMRHGAVSQVLGAFTGRDPSGIIYTVAFSPDGRLLASASSDSRIRLWNPATGTQIRQIKAHSQKVYSVAFSPDGQVLAAGDNTAVRLWNPATGEEIDAFRHGGIISSVAFSPDAQVLASAGDSAKVLLWNTITGQQIASFEGDEEVTCARFSPDGRVLASAHGEASWLWDLTTGKRLRQLRHDGKVSELVFSPDGRLLASVGDSKIWLWDPATGEPLWKLPHDRYVAEVAFSPDGRLLASVGDSSKVRLWNPATGEQFSPLRSKSTSYSVAISPDGQTLASGDVIWINLWRGQFT